VTALHHVDTSASCHNTISCLKRRFSGTFYYYLPVCRLKPFFMPMCLFYNYFS
jgi:hypothetical protein